MASNQRKNLKKMEKKLSAQEHRKAYWRSNLRILVALMSVWFIVSFGCGILFVDTLNKISIGGAKLGFWMAQQGSIYIFVAVSYTHLTLPTKA